MNSPIVDMVESQVIASITDPSLIEAAIASQSNIVFLLTGDLLTIKDYVMRLKNAGKNVFVHLDFVDGLANDKSAIEYIANRWKPDGIITTRNHLIKAAKKCNLITIQRIFLIDQSAFNKGIDMLKVCEPDAVEILPGIMPKIIHEMTNLIQLPIIAGGLIRTREEILESLKAGALATSIGDTKLWNVGL